MPSRDWRLHFTNAFHRPKIQKLLDKEYFKGSSETVFSKERLEGIIVRLCASLIEELEKKGK